MTRAALLAVLVLASAVLGGVAALAIGGAAGWLGDGKTETVVLPAPQESLPPPQPAVDRDVRQPLVGDGFNPAELYEKRAAGVVTVYSIFPDHAITGGAAQGSGFLVSDDGYILTNSHVITTAGEGSLVDEPEQASEVYVQFHDGDRVPADVVGWDVFSDVGLLKIEPSSRELSALPLGDSGAVVVGEPVAAIGSPFGNENSLSVGVVSATKRSIDSLTSRYSLVDAIQIDAPINRGNSGGPLFNSNGEVIGVNAQIRSESGNAEGVGFAVPINSAQRSMEQLIATGEVSYAWLGVSTQTLTPSLARHFGLGAERGAVVQCVVEDSPALSSGLVGGPREEEFEGVPFRPDGDLIVAVDGNPIDSAEDLVRAISQELLPGQTAELTVVRGGRTMEIDVTLAERGVGPDDRECL